MRDKKHTATIEFPSKKALDGFKAWLDHLGEQSYTETVSRWVADGEGDYLPCTLGRWTGDTMQARPWEKAAMGAVVETTFQAYINDVLVGTVRETKQGIGGSVWEACYQRGTLSSNFGKASTLQKTAEEALNELIKIHRKEMRGLLIKRKNRQEEGRPWDSLSEVLTVWQRNELSRFLSQEEMDFLLTDSPEEPK